MRAAVGVAMGLDGDGCDRLELATGWQLLETAPGAATDPSQLTAAVVAARGGWVPAVVPGTVASALRAAGRWSLDGPPRRFDASDWWYHCRFAAWPATAGERVVLAFDGLATLAEVWCNGECVLRADNMFARHEVDVGRRLRADNELWLRFASLDARLADKRPRPRWRAPMVEHQQLRWIRTTLLGRTPGWSPPAAAVGPWRAVRLERRRGFEVVDLRLTTEVVGDEGAVQVAARLRRVGATESRNLALARLAVAGPGDSQPVTAALTVEPDGGDFVVRGAARMPHVARWWPHTHGSQPLYTVTMVLDDTATFGCGRVGFRSIELDAGPAHDDGFALRVNGVPVFCRGACWTPLDVVTLAAGDDELAAALELVRAAGMNMLRLCGSTIYESDRFRDACDALGVLVWQDFMFANMDYPDHDRAFAATVADEVRQVLGGWQGRPSLALLCGDSEGEQQAAMWGAPRAAWRRTLSSDTLPRLCREYRPDVPYWPSSAHGGAIPHQPNAGTTSYYGVGAYRRPLEDARRAEVRFASECLAFANVPDDATLAALASDGPLRVHQPAWKERVPRDLGAGWDFDDVRDHYLAELFGVDPMALRASDHERYLALSRVVTGEVIAATFGEWRRQRSRCRGGLVWFLRDLWPGAGFGVVDAAGRPKAAYYYLRRALQPIALFVSDEGLNGLYAHIVNDAARELRAELRVVLYRDGEVPVHSGSTAVTVAAHSAAELPIATLFDGFVDSAYAHRFGPRSHDLVVATLEHGAATIAEAFHMAWPRSPVCHAELGLEAEVVAVSDGYDLHVRSRRFAQAVFVDAGACRPDDNYFHLAPGADRVVRLRGVVGAPWRGCVQALNGERTVPIRAEAVPC